MRQNGFLLFTACAAIGMTVCQWLIYCYAPVEASMGLVQKLFYVHLPLAWWSFVSFFTVFAASIAFLRTGRSSWDTLAHAAAELGVLLSGLALVTGSIWGRHSWGVWWTWDPRLTTTLVLWFLYAAYLVLRGLDLAPERRARVCAVLGIIAFLDVPLVFFASRLWRSIHPVVIGRGGGGLEPEMLMTLIACVLCFGCVWGTLCALRTRQLRQSLRVYTLMLRVY